MKEFIKHFVGLKILVCIKSNAEIFRLVFLVPDVDKKIETNQINEVVEKFSQKL